MAIIVNPAPPPQFIVQGRVGFDKNSGKFVDKSTAWMGKAMHLSGSLNPLGPTEKRYDPSQPHQDLRGPGGVLITPGQGTMRAHHIADHEIQIMVCDYMNGVITLPVLLDRVGALYLTSWIDVVVTPRVFKIWLQWAEALSESFYLVAVQMASRSPARQAAIATELCKTLSSSIANLRVGHGQTDTALGHGIAPRLQRGQFDLLGYFIGWLNGHNFAQPTLSVETSLVAVTWGGHFMGHPLAPTGHKVVVSNVFVGPAAGGNLFISEMDPTLPAQTATIALPQRYPGAQTAKGGYVLRATRATLHIGVAVGLLAALAFTGYKCKELVWPKAWS